MQMIEGLCVTLPKKKIYKLLWNNILALVGSTEEAQYCGFLILTRIVEGCAD